MTLRTARCGGVLLGLALSLPTRAEERAREVEVRGSRPHATTTRTHAREALAGHSVTTLGELEALDSSLSTSDAGNLLLRGIDAQGPLTTDTEGLASVYLAGLRVPQFALRVGAVPFWDLSNVRVTRGPVLFEGRHAPLGTLRVIAAEPGAEPDRARLTLAVPARTSAELAADAHLAPGLALRASALQRLAVGTIENETLGDDLWGADRLLGGRLVARLAPPALPDVTATLVLSALRRKTGLPDVELGRAPAESVSLAGTPSFERSTLSGAVARLEYRPAGALVASVQGTFVRHDYLSHFDEAFSPEPDGFRERELALVALDLEPRVAFRAGRVGLLFGGYALVERQEPDTLRREAVTELGDLRPVILSEAALERDLDDLAAYGLLTADLLPALRLELGARVERVRVRRRLRQRAERLTELGALDPVVDAALSSLVPSGASVRTAHTSAVLPHARVVLRASDRLTLELSARRGFRPGDMRHLPAEAGFVPYEPEWLMSYDAGASFRTARGAHLAQLNFFFIDWREQQVRVVRDELGLDAPIVNVAASAVYGVELAVTHAVSEPLALFGNATFSRPRITRFRDPLTGESRDGNALPYARSVVVVLGADYRDARGLHLAVDFRTMSGAFADLPNHRRLSPYSSFNLRVGHESERLGCGLFVRNALGTRTIAWRNDTLARPLVGLTPPREVGVEVESRF